MINHADVNARSAYLFYFQYIIKH